MLDKIIKEKGNGYSKYLRLLFRAYLTSNNEEFTDAVSAELRDSIQGKVNADCSYLDIIDLARLTYKNLAKDKA